MTEQQGGRPTREETTQKRRWLIVDAAVACFLEKGFHQTSVRDIAQKAEISLGNLYNHFNGKDALIAEIAMLEAAEITSFEQGLMTRGDPAASVEKFVDDYLAHCARRENAVLTAEIMAECMRNPAVGKGFSANRRNLARSLAGLLAKGIDTGRFDADLETGEAANLILDVIEGLAVRSALSGNRISKPARKALKAMIAKTIGA